MSKAAFKAVNQYFEKRTFYFPKVNGSSKQITSYTSHTSKYRKMKIKVTVISAIYVPVKNELN